MQQEDQDSTPSLRKQELSSSETTKSSEEKGQCLGAFSKSELNKEDSTCTKGGEVNFSQTTYTLQEPSVSQINGKGEKFCISLCQCKLWQLCPSCHVPTISRANIRTHATTWCATSESWDSWKLTYQKKLSFFFSKLTLCADLLLGHTGRGMRGWSHGSPKPHWLKLPQNCSMDKLLTNIANSKVHCKQERGVKCSSSLQRAQ